MAKGEPSGRYAPDPFLSSGEDPLRRVADLAVYVHNEFEKLAAALELARSGYVEFLNVAPARPREGDIAGADGTNWNPGGGKGIYAYHGGAWNKLG